MAERGVWKRCGCVDPETERRRPAVAARHEQFRRLLGAPGEACHSEQGEVAGQRFLVLQVTMVEAGA